MIPEDVMRIAQGEFLDWHGLGLGIVEMSHRSAEFDAIARHCEAQLRRLLDIPDEYRVLFEQGGGRGQFAAIPLNLLSEQGRADYFVTGHWSRNAWRECHERYGEAVLHECTRTDEQGRITVDYEAMQVSPGAEYAYLCANETVNGIELNALPDTGGVPLIADMSSSILTRPIDVSRFGVIMFGAQKNLAPAGLTVTIVRQDLLGRTRRACPSVLDWNVLDKYGSMYNTPPAFSWYMADLALSWIEGLGGVAELERRNAAKSRRLYGYVDSEPFYSCPIHPEVRSRVNCVFTLRDEQLNAAFLDAARERRLIGLKGHKALGGMRASLYNAMPLEGVEALIGFLQDFARSHS